MKRNKFKMFEEVRLGKDLGGGYGKIVGMYCERDTADDIPIWEYCVETKHGIHDWLVEEYLTKVKK